MDTFVQSPVTMAYSPHIKHGPDDLTPHWQFKSPVIMLQAENVIAAIVPDVDTITALNVKSFPPNIDLRNDGDTYASFSYTVTPTTLTFHSLYSRNTGTFMSWSPSSPFSFNHFLFLSSNAQPLLGYTLITSTLWSLFGHPRLQEGYHIQSSQFNHSLHLFDDWRADTWLRFAQQVYFEFPCESQTCGSMASYRTKAVDGFGSDEDGWFNSWFQTLRTSFGMHIAADRSNNINLSRQAVQVLNLALNAPQYNQSWGPFPSIFWLGSNQSINWVLDSGWAGLCRSLPNPPANCIDYYHTFDMSWTGYWLLQWTKRVNDSRIMPMVQGYADFLLGVQQENGGIPSWYEKNSLRPASPFLLINSEVAGSALFLAELYSITQDISYLNAALKAAEYLENNIIPTRRWFDYETFYSCSWKPVGFYDGFTNQFPENNLGKFQTAMLYFKLFKSDKGDITQKSSYLEMGSNILDYTLLTQQVWSHVLLSPNLLGGFTTQNTDSEWSDARQGYGAAILLDYYRATFRLEYLERGIAALRSSFAVAPYENWAHTGGSEGDVPGALTGIHWCQGSGMTSVEIHNDWLRDAYINLKYGHAVGVNGCSLSNLIVSGSSISVTINTSYSWPNNLVVSIEGLTQTAKFTVNGKLVANSITPSTPFTYINVPGNFTQL